MLIQKWGNPVLYLSFRQGGLEIVRRGYTFSRATETRIPKIKHVVSPNVCYENLPSQAGLLKVISLFIWPIICF